MNRENVPSSIDAVDSLRQLGYAVSTGAAPGYIDDRVCGGCHDEIADSYREVGMAMSFYRPQHAEVIEDFDSGEFIHPPSNNHYRMFWRDKSLFFTRHQIGPDGHPINEFEVEVDWILGSGHHSRSYIYRTPDGELYQLPVVWYTQEASWGMAPGFDRQDHLGVMRRVRRECMFCHNAYPSAPVGSDHRWAPHRYPEDLPEGIGCQRCHGPGAAHAGLALALNVNDQTVRQAIVNPSRLPPKLRNDVCFQCHLLPTVALSRPRIFGRTDYSFLPGEPLEAYLLSVDMEERDRSSDERFEINHHPYRLMQSQCFRASKGALTCLTCHDPHRRVPTERRAAHYRTACLECHEVRDCSLDEADEDDDAVHRSGGRTHSTSGDCVSCHMARRRTQDVVHVVMTDHRISRRPGGVELMQQLNESDPTIVGAHLLDPNAIADQGLREIYLSVAVAQTGASVDAVTHLEGMLRKSPQRTIDPYLYLAKAALEQKRYARAQWALDTAMGLERVPEIALAWRGLAAMGLGNPQNAERYIRMALEVDPQRAESHFNLGLILASNDTPEAAISHFERSVELRPNMAKGWYHLGVAEARIGNLDKAVSALRRSLEVDPRGTRAYLEIARNLESRGDSNRAARYLLHGRVVASRPDVIEKALDTQSPTSATTSGGE